MSVTGAIGASTPALAASARPPGWLLAATGGLALLCLAMALAETTLWMHYLIDGGEVVSLLGLVFILLAGVHLYTRRRLLVSLPLVFPWLLYPVMTQGDQIIDNLSINAMRIIVHLLLALLFGTPVAVIAVALRPRLSRRQLSLVAAALLTLEMPIAVYFLGTLMVVTLLIVALGVLLYGFVTRTDSNGARARSERFALTVLLTGVAASAGLFIGYKNRPGAYQGSPSYFMDPAQEDAGYRLDRIAVPSRAAAVPDPPDAVRDALVGYARTLDSLLAGYYILDRNYNYHFHNELFLRHTPLLRNYRAIGLERIQAARRLRADADARAAAIRPALAADDPVAALVDDVRGYVAFNVDRSRVLERMSAEFEKTKAGLQHATHIYEGEGKFLGARLADLIDKHRAVIDAPALTPVTGEFARISRSIHDAYAGRIVGF